MAAIFRYCYVYIYVCKIIAFVNFQEILFIIILNECIEKRQDRPYSFYGTPGEEEPPDDIMLV